MFGEQLVEFFQLDGKILFGGSTRVETGDNGIMQRSELLIRVASRGCAWGGNRRGSGDAAV